MNIGFGGPRKKKYLFIDAGFLKMLDSELSKKIANGSPESEMNIDMIKIISGYERAFYYDAFPTKKDHESEEQFNAKISQIEQEHNKLRLIPNLHVRSGITKFRKTRGMEQKGVDILLALEVYQHAISGNMDIAEIMTSDLDFYPLFESLVQTPVKAHLIYDPLRTSNDLVYSADQSFPIDNIKFLDWTYNPFRDEYYFQEKSHDDSDLNNPSFELIKQGILLDDQFMLFKDLEDGKYVGFSKSLKYIVRSKSEHIVLSRFDQIAHGEIVNWESNIN